LGRQLGQFFCRSDSALGYQTRANESDSPGGTDPPLFPAPFFRLYARAINPPGQLAEKFSRSMHPSSRWIFRLPAWLSKAAPAR